MPWEPLPSAEPDPPQAFGAGLDRLLRHLGAPAGAATVDVFEGWETIVGPQVAGHTRPLALRDRVLVLAVDDPAWATQLRFLEAEILTRLDAVVGVGEIDAIEVRVRRGGGPAGGPERPVR